MRHRRKGRVLGRSPSHQRALLRNLAAALMLMLCLIWSLQQILLKATADAIAPAQITVS